MSKNTDNDAQNLTGLPSKWDKLIKKMPEFKDTAEASNVDELKKIIVTCEGNIYTLQQEEDADVKLNAAREAVKQFSEPFREGKKVQQAKIQYALFLLEGKGTELGDSEKD